MNIKYAIQGDIGRESAQNILAVSSQLARSLEGQTTIKTIEIDSAKAIIKVNVDTAFIIIIVSAPTGVIFHPRSGSIEMLPYTEYISGPFGSMPVTKYLPGVAGGWRDGKTELTTEYIYPLVDEDNASFLVSKEDNEEELLGEFLGENGNYGNLYWWNGDEEEPVFLSWKGTPTRHFRLSRNIDIPGFSMLETSIPGATEDIPVYTAFGTNLYQDGTVLSEAPKWSWPYNGSGVNGRCLILGACQDTQGTTYIVTQSDHYNAPENVFIFSDGHREEGASSLKQTYQSTSGATVVFERELTKPGIFTTLWKDGGPVDGWQFVAEFNTGRQGLPWFGNADGTVFISSNGDKLTTGGVFTSEASTHGVWEESGDACEIVFESTHYSSFATEFLSNNIVAAPIKTFFVASTVGSREDNEYKTFEGMYPVLWNQPTLWAHTNEYWFVGQVIEVYGGSEVPEGDHRYTFSPAVLQPSSGDWNSAGYYFTSVENLCELTITDCKGRELKIPNPILEYDLAITGPNPTYVGASYNVSYGISPIRYSIDKGAINSETGKITSTSSCGVATITATDACGRTASIEVRLPTGVWLETSGCSRSSCSCGSGCSFTTYVGNVRYNGTIKCCDISQAACVPYCGKVDWSIVSGCGGWSNCSEITGGARALYFTSLAVANWVCP